MTVVHCPAKNTVSATGKITESKFKHGMILGLGLEVTSKARRENLHILLFFVKMSWFDVVKKMSVGDELTFKGVLRKNDYKSRNNLV